MIDEIKQSMSEEMETALKNLQKNLSKVRTGRATPSVLDGVVVDYYGASTPVNQVGQVSTPEARLLQIQPYDKNMIAEIEKSIINANLGLTPSNDGNFVRIPFPALTEEKRKDLVKQIKKLGEESKIQVRNVRRDKNEVVKASEKKKELSEDESKKYQDEVQKVTDGFIGKVDTIIEAKEKELMTV